MLKHKKVVETHGYASSYRKEARSHEIIQTNE